MSAAGLAGWARFAALRLLPILPIITSPAHAACPLPLPAAKSARLDETFQHQTISPGGFFALYWNSSGDSALAAERVPRILAALDSARAFYLGLPGAWDAPLGLRAHYPVLVVRQGQPGATTLPFADAVATGLTWIQLDCDFARWGGEPDLLLDATCAHEYFHALQFARSFDWRDLAFYESSAVWAEDQVFPAHDDWAWRYLPALLADLHSPLDATDGAREYGAGAVLKCLLAEAGGWEPCRDALLAADAQTRCWPALLAGRGAQAAPGLARALAELLHAGDGTPALAWRVPELAAAEAVDRADFTPLRPGAVVPPDGTAELAGLSWRALPLAGAGNLRFDAGDCAAFRLGSANQPEALADSSATMLGARDWLLLVNAAGQPHAGLSGLLWEGPWAGLPFRVWPNPGGSLRWVQFAGAPRPLDFFDLLGQRLGGWRPAPLAVPQLLTLPPAARGTLLVRIAGDDQGMAITLR